MALRILQSLGPMFPLRRGGSVPQPGPHGVDPPGYRPLLAEEVRVRSVRILAGGELHIVHGENDVGAPDVHHKLLKEVHLIIDDQADEGGANL